MNKFVFSIGDVVKWQRRWIRSIPHHCYPQERMLIVDRKGEWNRDCLYRFDYLVRQQKKAAEWGAGQEREWHTEDFFELDKFLTAARRAICQEH